MSKCENLSYSEIEVGLEKSFSIVLSRNKIDNFLKITGDLQPLHSDREYSKLAGYRDIISPGMLTSAFVSTLVGVYLPGLNALLLSQSFKYIESVYPGETLTIKGTVKKKIDLLSIIIISVKIINIAKELVSIGEVKVKVRSGTE